MGYNIPLFDLNFDQQEEKAVLEEKVINLQIAKLKLEQEREKTTQQDLKTEEAKVDLAGSVVKAKEAGKSDA